MTSKMLNEEMVASYTVEITGIERTRSEIAKLDYAIRQLRNTRYDTGGTATVAGSLGSNDLLVTKFDAQITGRIQPQVQRIMTAAMETGRNTQRTVLEQAVTETGLRRPGRGPGRNKTGSMIDALTLNVEVLKTGNAVLITGWHGWSKTGRLKRFEYQERGTKGRGQTSRTLASAGGSLSRRANKSYRERYAGQKRGRGAGVPAANSLGASIIPVREQLKKDLKGLKR